MENSIQFDTVTFVTTTAEQDTDLCPQPAPNWSICSRSIYLTMVT
ncbi:TPA: hypothetical protein ACGEYS_004762 [Kluyvera cryocrescens]